MQEALLAVTALIVSLEVWAKACDTSRSDGDGKTPTSNETFTYPYIFGDSPHQHDAMTAT
ncbi:hypothetical protein I5L64_29050 [Pseudomonas aeruginosa]|nr:hypothetical protein [Pseudomonas aeruginosa]MBH3510153.1 hypothetical protein [Pseudomonas aeruginosa]